MAAKDPRCRIITHMNADHTDSLVRYLEHQHSVPSRIARHAHLTDISLTHMTISVSGPSHNDTYRILFDPPLKDWAETRPRVVEMDHAAIKALDRDDITVKKYVRPQAAWQWGIMIACALTFVLLGRGRAAVDPSTPGLTLPLKQRFPSFFQFLWRIQPWLFYPMVGVHALEAVIMDQTRLRKHSVPRGGRVWWLWVVGTFMEGFPNFWRFDALVESERRKKEKQKH